MVGYGGINRHYLIFVVALAFLVVGLFPVSADGDPLDAIDDSAVTYSGYYVDIDVLANDTGESLIVGGLSTPAHGTVSVNDNGTVRYTPNEGYTGPDSFNYTLFTGSSLWSNDTGHYYEFITASVSWTDANSAANALTFNGLQGYLATVTSATENNFIQTKLEGNGWMGASDSGSEGVWNWVSGPEAGTQFWSGDSSGSSVDGRYNNWNGGEPNNAGNEDYAQFYITGKWNDLPDSSALGYVVEYGGMEGDESTFETATVTVGVIAAPEIEFVEPTTAAGTYTLHWWIAANVTPTELATNSSIDSVTIYLYNNSVLIDSQTAEDVELYYNFTGLTEGIYYLNASTVDTYSNTNATETRTIHLIPDCQLQVDRLTPLTNVDIHQNSTFTVQVNVSNSGSESCDSVNVTLQTSSGSDVSTTPGDTPFFTLSLNPSTIDLGVGESEVITWSVNASGGINTLNSTYAKAERNLYVSQTNQTTTWNATIVGSTEASIQTNNSIYTIGEWVGLVPNSTAPATGSYIQSESSVDALLNLSVDYFDGTSWLFDWNVTSDYNLSLTADTPYGLSEIWGLGYNTANQTHDAGLYRAKATVSTTSGLSLAETTYNFTIASSNDSDGDGVVDDLDNLEGNESSVGGTGVTNLNITVGGNSTNGSFNGLQEVAFYDNTAKMLNFTHNFSSSQLDLSRVTIIKTPTSILINMSGQLQSRYRKTVYIDDNNFITLCVKDAEISSISAVSDACDQDNETSFTDCLGNSTGITRNGLTCTDLGDTIRVENLTHSAVRGTQAPSGGTGKRDIKAKLKGILTEDENSYTVTARLDNKQDTGALIMGATVKLTTEDNTLLQTCTTDKNGGCALTKPGDGTYTITAEKNNYRPHTITITNGQPTTTTTQKTTTTQLTTSTTQKPTTTTTLQQTTTVTSTTQKPATTSTQKQTTTTQTTTTQKKTTTTTQPQKPCTILGINTLDLLGFCLH